MMRHHIFAFVAIFLLPFSISFSQSNHPVALKAGLGSIFTEQISVEAELYLKGRTSVAVRLGIIQPSLDPDLPIAEGFFLKAGPRFYLSAENATQFKGFSLQPQAVLGYWKNVEPKAYVIDRSQTTLGLIANLSYGWKPFEHVLIEPSIGLGFVATYESASVINDQPPFETIPQSWYLMNKDEINGGVHSHLPLTAALGLSGGLMVGIQF